MTWPDGIAAALITAMAVLVLIDQHRTRPTTTPQHQPDGEPP